jgi:hypothetical protein
MGAEPNRSIGNGHYSANNTNRVINFPCIHWRDCGLIGGGCCAIDAFDGHRPSFGTCMACEKYEGPPRGLGDSIHNFTTLTGIKALRQSAAAVAVLGPCNCEDKRKRLNREHPSQTVSASM